MLSYEGIFFDAKTSKFIHSLEEKPLSITNDKLHCTFKYHPKDKEIFNDLLGKEIEVEIVGYACDGKNSGFEIKLPKEISKYYINYNDQNKLIIPHITASLSEDVKPIDTCNLEFKKLQNPVKIQGKFGFWIKNGKKEYISYKKY